MPAGEIVAPVFYLLVMFAALTSAVSLLETVVSVFIDGANLRRNISIIASAALVIVLGIIVVLGFGPLMTDLSPFDQGAGWLGIFDSLTNSFLMPIVAILTCIFIGYVVKITFITEEVESEGNQFLFKRPFEYMIKYICPICLAAILIFGMLEMFDIFHVY